MQEKELYKTMCDGLRERLFEICLAEPEMQTGITLNVLCDLFTAILMTAPTKEMCLETFEEYIVRMKTNISLYDNVKREKQN